jgi:hypothetical protein
MATLVKATLTELNSLESVSFLFNPSSYQVETRREFVAPPTAGGGLSALQSVRGGAQRFRARAFLDSGDTTAGAGADLRSWVARVERWSVPNAETGLPPQVLFSWGTFRFRGVLEDMVQEWVRFAPDGTPLRGWLDVVLRT